MPNGMHTAFEREFMRQRIANPLQHAAGATPSANTAALGLASLGQSLHHQNPAQPNLDLALLEQLQRQQQQQALLGRSMLGAAGLAPTAPSPAPSMMFNPATLMGLSNPGMAAQLYGKMNPALNAAGAVKRDN